MTWLRTDDGFPEHPKCDALAEHFGDDWATLNLAFALWHHMGCDCAARRTDGAFNAPRAYRVMRAPRGAIDKALEGLAKVGLLERRADCLVFHDWAQYQPTRAQLDAERDAKNARQARWREGRPKVDGKETPARRDVDASTRPSVDASRDGSVDAAPSRPDPSRPDPRESDARAPEARCPTTEPATTSATDPAEVLASMRAASSGLVADPTTTSAGELVAVKRAVDALLSRGVALDVIARSAAHLAHGHWTQRSKRSVITAGRLVEERDGRGSILGELLADADGCAECRPAKLRQTLSRPHVEPVNAPPPMPAKPTPAGLRIAALGAMLRAEREAEERARAEAKVIA